MCSVCSYTVQFVVLTTPYHTLASCHVNTLPKQSPSHSQLELELVFDCTLSASVQERERKEEEERIRTENLLKGNPLLNQQQQGSSFAIKRR